VTDARAVVLSEFDQPVRLETFPVPEPAPGAVLAEVEFGGVCGTDVHLQAGRLPIPLPVVLGHEGVGRVRALGEGVDRDSLGVELRVGDAISWGSNIACGHCVYCRDVAEPSLCENRRVYGINRSADVAPHLTGSWADVIHLDAGSTIVRLGEDAPSRAVIALGCAGPTTVHGVLGQTPPRVGETVIVQGAGPVGLAAAMYAQLAGAARVVLVGAPAGRIDVARSHGIGDEHIEISDLSAADRGQAALDLTPRGGGADLVIECTGVPPAVAEGIGLCRPGGRYLVLGQYTDHGPTPINPHLITRKQLEVRGSWAFSARDVVQYCRTVPILNARFELAPLVQEFPLDDAQGALDAARAGRVVKAVVAAG
jgi:threonine dehydrogenase-like Zn-dependent dehydrogenase